MTITVKYDYCKQPQKMLLRWLMNTIQSTVTTKL